MNAVEFANQASKLFSVPRTALKIKELSDSNTADMREIVAVIESDPGLASHILKLANSAVYRFSRKVEQLDRALQIIGLNSAYEFALAFALADSLETEHEKFISIHDYWFQSLSCALMAKKLAEQIEKRAAARLFLVGLFHNIGELAVLRVEPVIARECTKIDVNRPPLMAQQKVLGFTFAEVSAALLQKWMLPDAIVTPVAMQHPDELPPISTEVAIIQLSYTCAIQMTYPAIYKSFDAIPERLYTALALEPEYLKALIQEVQETTNQTIGVFTDK